MPRFRNLDIVMGMVALGNMRLDLCRSVLMVSGGKFCAMAGHGNAKPEGAVAMARVKDDATLPSLAHVVCYFCVGVE